MAARLGLGTVQFGIPYGVSNQGGMPSDAEVGEILKLAADAGVEVLDTAALYGQSEEVLGRQDLSPFRIVTKTPRFATAQIGPDQAGELRDCFQRSLRRLGGARIYGLLCHHAPDLLAPGGDWLWHSMEALRDEGRVERIGVSIYDGEQLDALVGRYPLGLVQIPINVLDQRLINGGQLERLRRAGIKVHARSAFLQGLLLMDEYPAYFGPILPHLERWKSAVTEAGLRRTSAALSFLRELPGIDVVLVGVTGRGQLQECVRDFSVPTVFAGRQLACDIPDYMDPSKWKLQ